jgi:hypothetical protein
MYREVLLKSIKSWMSDIAVGILPSFRNNPTLNKVNNIMGAFLGLDLSNYNIMSEFSFLIPTILGNYVDSYVNQGIDMLKISDEDIPSQVNMILDSCINQCQSKGFISIYGLQFESEAFKNLKEIFNRNLSTVAAN